MNTGLQYLEDYLLFMYNSGMSQPIKLATYDKSPVANMATAAIRANMHNQQECLTDRQVHLARTIIAKYRRQFLQHGIAIPDDVHSIEAKYNTRHIDREQSLRLDEETKTLYLKFPYSSDKISTLYTFANESCGPVVWNNNEKIWSFAYTEGNLSAIIKLLDNEDTLKVSKNLEGAIAELLSVRTSVLPSMVLDKNRMQLVNCHSSVEEFLLKRQWVDTDMDNLEYWVSQAATCELRIDESVTDLLKSRWGETLADYIVSRKIIAPSKNLPTGPWIDNLKQLNHILKLTNWFVSLDWWVEHINWAEFQRLQLAPQKDKTVVNELNNEDYVNMIAVFDSVLPHSKGMINEYISQYALKTVYISDMGGPVY